MSAVRLFIESPRTSVWRWDACAAHFIIPFDEHMRTKAKEQNFNRNYFNLMSLSLSKRKLNRIEHSKCMISLSVILLCYYESAGVRWACVCSFIMPMKCQQNKSLPRCCCGLKYIFYFFLICCLLIFVPHRTHPCRIGSHSMDEMLIGFFVVAHHCAVERCSL